jgi:hypothetical protein
MLGVFRHGQSARRSGKKIQVVNVVSGSGDHGMKAIAYEHGVAIASFHRALARVLAGVQMLKRESFRLANPVIIDLV